MFARSKSRPDATSPDWTFTRMKRSPDFAAACSMPRILRRWRRRAATRPGIGGRLESWRGACGRNVFVGDLIAGQLGFSQTDDRRQPAMHATVHERLVQAAHSPAKVARGFTEVRAGIRRENLGHHRMPGLRLAAIEGELDVGHAHHVAVAEIDLLDSPAVDERAIGAAEISNSGCVPLAHQGGMFAGDSVGDDLQIGRFAAPDEEGRLLDHRFFRRAALGGKMLKPR